MRKCLNCGDNCRDPQGDFCSFQCEDEWAEEGLDGKGWMIG